MDFFFWLKGNVSWSKKFQKILHSIKKKTENSKDHCPVSSTINVLVGAFFQCLLNMNT